MQIELQKTYNKTLLKSLQKDLGYKSHLAVPRLEKIVVSVGMGESIMDSKALENAKKDLEAITGQASVMTTAKKSIASFKLREGMKIGLKVTLRRERMYAFLERLLTVAIPRIRDFQGIPLTSFDGNGNYSLGIKEQLVFPELSFDSVDKIRGLQITFVTSAKSDEEAMKLFTALGFPFKKK